ncbi:lipopolysaccharide assembly protein LapA domain-containing protein [Pseudidiomarina sp.]|uniref:lipopolysaccharide assembly protein LapA domain-containing protein n=1 Tax=Pseudidiomarina sp. TaxID=2081707 RepID=UPI003A97A792
MIRFVFVSLPLIVLFLIAVAFGALNKHVIDVDFIVVQQQVSVAALAAIFLALGFIIGLLSMLGAQLMLRRDLRKVKKQLVSSKSAP